jgi:hypothetical protein
MQNLESPKHSGVRKFLRTAGPLILAVGVLLLIVGVGSFFVAMFTRSGPPVLFVCAFVGMPLLFIGTVMCMFGFMGALARYIATEQAPVAKDTINYMAEGTQDAVRHVARAAAQGVSEGMQSAKTKSTEAK